ncbi:MAG: type II toxin-antitoxin system ParD family antitoxin [Methylobacteriaceae bacterium]|nr:type II toxin-antitoxin system ParD family antitoxin [Methylobacteriaceae bacterium]
MARIEKRTFSLPPEHAAFIDAKVASGAFASGSEVVRAALRALQERDAAVEDWLCEEGARTCDLMRADPSRAIPIKAVFDEVRALSAGKIKAGK